MMAKQWEHWMGKLRENMWALQTALLMALSTALSTAP
jgi:hypothetical protein